MENERDLGEEQARAALGACPLFQQVRYVHRLRWGGGEEAGAVYMPAFLVH